MKGILNRYIASMITLIVFMSSVFLIPCDVYADDETVGNDVGLEVVYERYANKSTVETYFGKKAPTYSGDKTGYGYLFGGWFTKVTVDGETKYKPIKEGELDSAPDYYAKFVPSYVLGIKCQNMHDATVLDATTTMRFVSGVDSTNYAEIGFIVNAVSLDTNKNFKKSVLVGTTVGTRTIDTVYEKLYVYKGKDTDEGTKHTPQQVLGKAAKYFMTYRINNVKQKNYDKSYSIQPYWKTFDGVMVTGLTKYAHIEDGFNGYINIPINLKNSNAVAAGLLEFDWSDLKKQGYEFLGVECGTVFQKKQIEQKENNIIRCLAVVSDMSKNSNSDNIYLNLRFKQGTGASTKTYDGNFYHFRIGKAEFANITETVLEKYEVWNIQY